MFLSDWQGKTFRRHGRLLVLLTALAECACGSDAPPDDDPSGPPRCLEQPANAACETALYGVDPTSGDIAPTFHDVFTNTIQTKCAATTACHSGSNAPRGLVMDDEETAYQLLLDEGSNGEPRVSPGDVECGDMIVRLESPDTTYGMPPGRPLSEAELCSIRHWIANGAPR